MPVGGRGRFAGFLIACAADVEREGLDDVEVSMLGVGKVAAAIGAMEALRGGDFRGVLLFGVAGAFPARHRPVGTVVNAVLAPGDLCIVGEERLGDEGVLAPGGFEDLSALGLGEVGPFALAADLVGEMAGRLEVPVVAGVTVSTCSGTEAASLEMARRSGAAIETMEGAAVALVCRRLGVPLVQVRAISNWTGDRERGAWDLKAAVQRVQDAVRSLLAY